MSIHPIRPHGISSAGTRLWRYGDGFGPATTDAPPIPGDLWLIAEPDPDFGEADRLLVLVTAVVDDLVIGGVVHAMPVTPAEAPAHAPALHLDGTTLGADLIVWPDLETRIAFGTLTRRIGPGIEAFTLARLRGYVRGDLSAPLPAVEAPFDPAEHAGYDADLVATLRWARNLGRSTEPAIADAGERSA